MIGGGGLTEGERTVYPEGPYGEEVGSVIAPLSFVDTNGDPFGLEQIYLDTEGKLLLVTTSAEWCTACIKEQPKLEELYEDYGPQGLQVLVVLFEDGSFEPATVNVAERWKNRYELTFPVVADPVVPSTFSDYYNVDLTPMIMLVDINSMTIKYVTQGFDEDQVIALISTYLAER